MTAYQVDLYRQAFGLTPGAFEFMMAILSHYRVYGVGCTRRQAGDMCKAGRVNAQPLLIGGWLSVAPGVPVPDQILTPTDRAWRNLWPWRLGWPEEERTETARAS